MKDLIAKIKTLNYKQLALAHGEKIGIGVIGIVVLVCLGMTNWASEYTKSPRDMEEQADTTDKKLKGNIWPDTEKAKFIPPLAAEHELASVYETVDRNLFDWPKPLSKKLHPRQLPADEPVVLTAMELRAKYDQAAIGVQIPETAGPSEEAEQPRARPARGKQDRGGRRGGADESPLPPPKLGMAVGMDGGFSSGGSGEKARGRRFVVVTGVIDLQQQYSLLMKALHLNSKPEAIPFLEYHDFKIQRQRAVPGSDHWTGEWIDIAKENSIEILNEASAFDPDVVATPYTQQVITSPLPRRIDDIWDPQLVAHPRVPTLSEAEQEMELRKNQAARETLKDEQDDEDEGPGAKRGFAVVQKDAKRMQTKAMSVGGGSKMMEAMQRMMGGMAEKARGQEKNQMMGAEAMMKNMATMMGGMGGRMNRGAAAADMGAEYLLFRFFDFDVEPGECYRYRAQLVIENPSQGQSFVSAPTVAVGALRESAWSKPSTPVVVEKDVEYALSRAVTKGKNAGAELSVVQFDMENGTYLSDKFGVPIGAYVAAVNKKTLHLDVGTPKFEEEEVNFTSKDVLLDSVAAPELSETIKKDLGLDAKAARDFNKGGKLDMAVTMNRFGEIIELDYGSKDGLKPFLDRVDEERKDYKDIKDAGKKKKDDVLGDSGDDAKGKKKKRRRDKVDNPLKVMSSMMMPGMMGPPSSGTGSKKGKN